MKKFPVSVPLWLVIGAGLLAPLCAARAQSPQAAPNLTPKRPHAAKPDADADADEPDLSQPVATVNGVAVYRPLMKSIVANPVDRALLVNAYRKSGQGMSASDKDFVTKQLELSQFNGSDKKLDARLQKLNATRDDYKQYAVEEAKIRDVLRNMLRGASSPHSAQQRQADYLAQLRHGAAINTTRQ